MSDTSSSSVVKALIPCAWAKGDDYLAYHNNEWGVPNFDRQKLFEKLCLEGQQAGLSWITVLRKRDHYRQCFHGFNPQKIARMTDEQIELLLTDTGLIRNRLKLYVKMRWHYWHWNSRASILSNFSGVLSMVSQ